MYKNNMCLKCKHLNTSDIPNLFCNLTCQLVNDTEFEYCPKDPACVVVYVENLKSQIELLKVGAEKGILRRDFDLLAQNRDLKQQLELKNCMIEIFSNIYRNLLFYSTNEKLGTIILEPEDYINIVEGYSKKILSGELKADDIVNLTKSKE